MLVQDITVRRRWATGSDIIRHSFNVSHRLTARSEALTEAIRLWDSYPKSEGRTIEWLGRRTLKDVLSEVDLNKFDSLFGAVFDSIG